MAIRISNNEIYCLENGTVAHMTEFFGNSTDTKPTDNLVNGSTFTEVDTGDVYLFDEVAGDWVLTMSLQG